MKCIEIYAEFDIKNKRRYKSALDFAETHWADAPYLEFKDEEVVVGDTTTISAVRKGYQYFESAAPVDLTILYKFKDEHATCKFVIKGDKPYTANSWIMDTFMHDFTTEQNSFKNLKVLYEAKEVSA